MKTHILLLACLAFPAAAQRPVPFVAPDALVTLQADGFAKIRSTFEPTNLGELLADSRIKALYMPAQALIQAGTRMAEAEADADIEELVELLFAYEGRMTVAVELLDDQLGDRDDLPFRAVYILAPDGVTDLARVARICADAAATFPASQTTELEIDGVTLTVTQDAGQDGIAVPAIIDGHLVMFVGSGIEDAIKQFFRSRGGSVIPSYAPTASVAVRANGPRVSAALSRFLESRAADGGEDAERMAQLLKALGGDDIEAFELTVAARGTELIVDTAVTFKQDATGYFGVFVPKQPGNGELPAVVPSDAGAWAVQTVRIDRLLDIVELVAGGEIDLEQAFEERTGYRLRADFLDHMGDEFVVLADPQFFESAVREEGMPRALCLGLALTDSAGFRTTIEKVLVEEDLVPQKSAYGAAEISSIEDDQGAFYWTVHGGYLLLAFGDTGLAMLHRAIDAGAGPAPRAPIEGIARRLKAAPAGWDSAGACHIAPFAGELLRLLEEDGELPSQAGRIAKMVLARLADFDLEYVVSAAGYANGVYVQRYIW